ncbi:MAG: RNA-directed DNA polymerase [bacterium]|nr:RNA-directed DNA polymerase [bacterium]
MKRQLSHKFNDIISVENLLSAWREFIRGKRNRRDVQEFSLDLMDNIFALSADLTRTCWALKCDIRKFFANIDHDILIKILKEYISDENIIWLLKNVIDSFTPGLPLGNLTSQLFVNIYMNKFNQFMKHGLKTKYYIRYADDFIIFSENKEWLEKQTRLIKEFLRDELKLELHPDKIFIKTITSGVDFLGMVNFNDYRVLRTKTKRRMFKKISGRYNELYNKIISEESFNQSLQSYLGMLKHCQGHKVKKEIVALISGFPPPQ